MAAVTFIPEYTIADYLTWQGDWELWSGIPVAMSPSPNFRHQRICRKVVTSIQLQLEAEPCDGGCEVIYEMDWHVDDSTVVRPDVMVVCEEPQGDFVDAAPVLVVEVLSDSTRKKDLVSKRKLYANRGVKFYLIVDPSNDSVEFLQLDANCVYTPIADDAWLALDRGCRVRIDRKYVFAR